MKKALSLRPLLAAPLLIGAASLAQAQLPGAIFTTDSTGTIVNGNTKYESKCGATGVWLDGGPGVNAPIDAAGLPDGEYYFQVTDPSGKNLLSTDKVNNRCVQITGGIITGNCAAPAPGPGTHNLNDSVDAGGGKVVELCPFKDTPNNGGVYKAWLTPAANFVGNPELIDPGYKAGSNFHGFVPATSKTDNFKVKDTRTYCIAVHKDVRDEKGGVTPGADWLIRITDNVGATDDFYTDDDGNITVCFQTAGIYTVAEVLPAGSSVVGTEVDGIARTPSTTVTIEFKAGEKDGATRSVRFINTPCLSKCYP